MTTDTISQQAASGKVVPLASDKEGGVHTPNVLSAPRGREYETVAASQSDQALGATGAAGDDLDGLLVVPATTSPGAVSIKDGGGSAITVFPGGATSVVDLKPFFIPLRLRSLAGAWKVTTGANVSVVAVGNFAA
jgi:hypothetical protein